MSENIWFVTGSSRGLGYAIAEQVLAAGHKVAATARTVSALKPLVDEYGEQILPLPLDVTDPEQVQAAVTRAVEHFGRLDVVVNNAGYANMAPIENIAMDDFRAQVEAVFYGTVLVTKAVLPILRRQGAGHIIQVTSIGGRITAPGMSAYQSAKWAVEGFTGVLAKEVGPLGIKVTLAEPGAMRTDWAGSSMRIPEFDPAYQQTVGTLETLVRSRTGKEPIDPVKVAQALIFVTEQPEPPLHLLLGRDAVRLAAQDMETVAAEDEKWAFVGTNVDYADGE
ncbi:SDR family NAD(P)-dependent oxidoreductase [Catenulispora yoronensis]|uniref:SDR family NAD(P)-dependent oxidoreductase n=1 Tax=Catenulispora yoronensis TaxID=450799 RepID=A0ABN2TK48_9ACTN